MNVKRKRMCCLFLSMLFLLFSACVQAAFSTEITVNDIIENEKVIRVHEDGSYITLPLVDIETANNEAACEHFNLSTYSSYKQTKESDLDNMCYKIRTVSEAKCLDCGKTGFKHYGIWTYEPHDYPFFGNTCRTCGKVK